ncbi:hypothetical protein ACH5RR_032382 [Cinchona calisaya]|uniref:Uncharacterized protein n=1 Tax=Cinchona calisaya TaxID=153742 RepID=A0ABD2YLF1_9GENT
MNENLDNELLKSEISKACPIQNDSIQVQVSHQEAGASGSKDEDNVLDPLLSLNARVTDEELLPVVFSPSRATFNGDHSVLDKVDGEEQEAIDFQNQEINQEIQFSISNDENLQDQTSNSKKKVVQEDIDDADLVSLGDKSLIHSNSKDDLALFLRKNIA